jgi:NADPH2:quinone reductase
MTSNGALPPSMRAVEITSFGGPEVLQLATLPLPRPGPGEVLIKVAAAALNRGDIMQRMGFYPAPPGISPIPGLEVAGTIAACGAGVSGWHPGDPVCAILAGGGYAEYAVAPAVQCLPIPAGYSMAEAGALPECLFTCWTNLIDDGHLKAGETLLIHGGASGIGTTGIQLAKLLGVTVYVTAGNDAKCAACIELGADLAINYKTQDFVEVISTATQGRGVDVVLDIVGGDYIARSMQIMAQRARHVTIGIMAGGFSATIPVPLIIQKRLTLTGSSLRGRPPAEKGAIAAALQEKIWPQLGQGKLKPLVHACFPLSQAAAAHSALEASEHVGKIVLISEP